MNNDPTAEKIAGELRNSVARLRAEIDRVELWAMALSSFAEPIPNYEPGLSEFQLPPRRSKTAARADSEH